MRTLIINARIWDGLAETYDSVTSVLVEDDRIVSVGEIGPADATIDLAGRALLPGFIDAHFHAYANVVDVPYIETLPLSYLAHHGRELLEASLLRGFTTVRDAGGAEWGLAKASEEGMIVAPRLFWSGRGLSQTGGHGDERPPHTEPCACGTIANLSQVVDGVDAVRAAARENLRRGATQLKIFVSGGFSSPSDPIAMIQYSPEEIRAVVAEARSRQTYVMAHAYTGESIIHAVTNGVRTIEHGNLLTAEAAAVMAEHGAFLVPTLVTYDATKRHGVELGLSKVSQIKLDDVADRGLDAIRLARSAGVQIGFGTDLLGPLHKYQLQEFRLRALVDPPVDVLRSATSVNARILNMEGQLGVIAQGAFADLVAVGGDPLADLATLCEHGPQWVMRAGRVIKPLPF